MVVCINYSKTCRYCLQWYKIAPSRVNMQWWDRVMAPLKELESIATGHNSVTIDNIRAGKALICAGAAAAGETIITGLDKIERGYQNIDNNLRALGLEVRINRLADHQKYL